MTIQSASLRQPAAEPVHRLSLRGRGPTPSPSERLLTAALVLTLSATVAWGTSKSLPVPGAAEAVIVAPVANSPDRQPLPVAATPPLSATTVAVSDTETTAAPTPTPLPARQPLAAVAPAEPAQTDERAATTATQSAALLPANRILTYYGHPHDANMGIVGEYSKEDLLQLLLAEAANYEAADPTRPVIPAFEVIATVAQDWPAQDGQYVLDTDMETLTEYADFAEANGILLVLDLQIGRNTVPNEIAKVLPLLERPNVHLALDPEFAIAPGQEPGTHIGEVTSEQITTAQETLAALAAEQGLPPKLLIIHQFREDMIVDKERLGPVPGVQLVIESDGFGSPAMKTEVYDILIGQAPVEYNGIKLFYKQDEPLMTPADIVSLSPSPNLVVYQ